MMKSQFFTHIDVSVEMDYEGLQTHSMQKDILLSLADKEHYVDALIWKVGNSMPQNTL